MTVLEEKILRTYLENWQVKKMQLYRSALGQKREQNGRGEKNHFKRS